MDYALQGPLHRKWFKAKPTLGPFNGDNHVNHVFTRGGVDHYYRLEPAAGVVGPPKVWVHWKTQDMTTMVRPKATIKDIEFLDE